MSSGRTRKVPVAGLTDGGFGRVAGLSFGGAHVLAVRSGRPRGRSEASLCRPRLASRRSRWSLLAVRFAHRSPIRGAPDGRASRLPLARSGAPPPRSGRPPDKPLKARSKGSVLGRSSRMTRCTTLQGDAQRYTEVDILRALDGYLERSGLRPAATCTIDMLDHRSTPLTGEFWRDSPSSMSRGTPRSRETNRSSTRARTTPNSSRQSRSWS